MDILTALKDGVSNFVRKSEPLAPRSVLPRPKGRGLPNIWIIGRHMRSRIITNQKTEAAIGCNILNRMAEIGMPQPNFKLLNNSLKRENSIYSIESCNNAA